MTDALSSIHKCVLTSGRRESALFSEGGETSAALQRHTQQILLAFVAVLQQRALHHDADQVTAPLHHSERVNQLEIAMLCRDTC